LGDKLLEEHTGKYAAFKHTESIRKTQTGFIITGKDNAELIYDKLGLLAVSEWEAQFNELCQNKPVIIIPDDTLTLMQSETMATELLGIAKYIKILEIPQIQSDGVEGWIQAGGTTGKLKDLIKQNVKWTAPKLDPMTFLQKGSDLQALDIKIEWIVDKLLPKQAITLLHGRGGIGKTWLSHLLADAITKGLPFMGQVTKLVPVVCVDFENSMPVLVDRVRKIGIENVLFWHSSNEIQPPPKLDNLKWELYKTLPPGSLLIFDTLRAAQGRDENNSQDMAFILDRLKALRDAGFTILLLHHTPKGNDRIYKGSTAILDLADHILSLHRVRKNNLDEIIDDDENEECFYRLGTKDKTRYEPFHLFMNFDKERGGFKKAMDPDTEDMEAIRDILLERGSMNQTHLFNISKTQLDIAGKGKFTSLLYKGEGKYWKSIKEKRAVFYEALSIVQLSTPYISNSGQIGGTVQTAGTDGPSDTHKTLDNSELSNCPGVSGQVGQNEVIEVTEY
jgi:hypothetical protein